MNGFLRSKPAAALGAFVMIAAVIAIPFTSFAVHTHAQSTVTFTEFHLPTLSTSGSAPSSITKGPDGNLWFTERNGAGNIGKITPTGTITEYPPPTTGASPTSITTGTDGNLWFTEGSKIGKSTPAGNIVEYPLTNSLNGSWDITTGPDGNLWFTESNGGSESIGKMDTSGTITAEYQVPCCNAGLAQSYIVAGPDGNLWFTEPAKNEIGRITTGGDITEFTIPSGNKAYAITTGPDGNLWFTEYVNEIGTITTSGTVTEYPITVSGSNVSDAFITTGPDGNLWLTEPATNKIGTFTLSGGLTDYPLPTNCGDATSGCGPDAITLGPDNNLWFTEYNGDQIGRVNLSSPTPTPSPSPTLSPSPSPSPTLSPSPTITPSPTPTPRGKLVVYLVGLSEHLSITDASKNQGYGYASSFYSSGDIQPYLQGKTEFKGAQSLVFSYRGFTADGKPGAFPCWDTYNNQISFDAALLNLQITQYLNAHPNTDVYLVAHSLGGVIAFSYMTSLIEITHSAVLANGGALKGISINDSPLGGITNNSDYENTIVVNALIHPLSCPSQYIDFTSVGELQTLFNTASSTTHRGKTASVLNAFLGGRYITNQQVASDAMAAGIVTLVVGNINDLLWRPEVCNSTFHTNMSDFLSTEYLSEVGKQSNGGAIYSRAFTSGSLSCSAVFLNKANHLDVLKNTNVEKAIWEAFTGRPLDVLTPVKG